VDVRPDFSVVKHAGGVGTHALSWGKGEYAIYLDGSGPVEVRLNLIPGEYQAWWVDVMTGEKVHAETVKYREGEFVVKSPAFENGILLRISRRAYIFSMN